MRLKDYIKYLLTVERYSFSLDEAIRETSGQGSALKFELARLREKNEIISLRKGFYLIIPPRYSKQGKIPIQLYVENLANSLDRKYYLGLYSAARFHGASHQQSQQEYVMIETPKLRDINKSTLRIKFLTNSKWPSANIQERKSDAGLFKISSPALTAIDLIHHQSKLGGLNRMIAVIEELLEEINSEDIEDLITWYPHKSSIQRLGFLLQTLEAEDHLLNPIIEYLNTSNFYPVLLSPKSKERPGAVNNRWKIDVNINIESDL